MPELGSYGSVRGARGNSRPYREPVPGAVRLPKMNPLRTWRDDPPEAVMRAKADIYQVRYCRDTLAGWSPYFLDKQRLLPHFCCSTHISCGIGTITHNGC
jgi:hypothetical protein